MIYEIRIYTNIGYSHKKIVYQKAAANLLKLKE